MVDGSGRRALTSLLIVTLLTTGLGAAGAQTQDTATACPPEAPPAPFPDVGSGNVHAPAIACLAWDRHGVVRGRADGSYGPAESVRRDQMAGFVARTLAAAGVDLPADPRPVFTDTSGNTFAREINQLAELGVVQGRGPGAYAPADAVTRAQMATFLVQAHWAATATSIVGQPTAFADTSGNTHEANIDLASSAGFTAGTTPTTFSPAAPVRRDQMATFLVRLLDRLLGEELLADPKTTGEGFVFLAGSYLVPPYTVEVVDLEIRVNGQPAYVRPRTEPIGELVPPADPEDAFDLVQVADARLRELGGPGPDDPDDAVVAELVALLTGYSVTAEVRVEPGRIVVRDTAGNESGLFTLQAERGTEHMVRTALQQDALAWAQVLRDGGVVLTEDGASLLVPGTQTAGFLHELGDVFDLPDDQRPAALEAAVGDALAPSLLASGDPRPTIGGRMPERPVEAAEVADVTGQSHGVSGTRTPASHHAWVFTPFEGEVLAVCWSWPVIQAAHRNGYRLHIYKGSASTMERFIESSGAGVFYGCAHQYNAYEYFYTPGGARDEAARLQALGYRNVSVQFSVGRWYLVLDGGPLRQLWRSGQGIVHLDMCHAMTAVYALHAREVIGSPFAVVRPALQHGNNRRFWGRLDGSIAAGTERHVGAAFPPAFGGTQFRLSGSGRGATVLTPAVATVVPAAGTTHAAPGTVRGRVVFDAAMRASSTQHSLLVDGPCAAPSGTPGRVVTRMVGEYTLDFEVAAAGPGELRLRIAADSAQSADAVLALDGNTSPVGTDHVAPVRDDYFWTVQCVPAEGDSTGVDPDPDPTPTPSVRYALGTRVVTEGAGQLDPQEVDTLRLTPGQHYPKSQFTVAAAEPGCDGPHYHAAGTVHAVEGGSATDPNPAGCGFGRVGEVPEVTVTVPAVTVTPARADYAAGEQVSVTVPDEFTIDGHRHLFGMWAVDPGVPHEVDAETLWVTMESDVTATAYYESVPP